VLGVVADGRDSALFQLQPQRERLGELSAEVVDSVLARAGAKRSGWRW
jgi:hypothetical protein